MNKLEAVQIVLRQERRRVARLREQMNTTYSDTRAEARPTQSEAQSLADRCLQALREYGAMTPDECAQLLRIDKNSIRPRFTQLKKAGLIADTGERRLTAQKKRAAVMTATT